MGWPKLLVLVRHAESEGNIRTVEERAEYEVSTHAYRLTKRGKNQAEITGQYLRKEFGSFDACYTSYYARAKETLQIMYPEAKATEDSRLAEAQRGIWHSMTSDQIAKIFPHEIERKEKEDLYHYRPLGGENWPDIEMRIHGFRGTLNCHNAGERVLVVSHGHWLILWQKVHNRWSAEQAMQRYEAGVFENASVTIYESVWDYHKQKSNLTLLGENIVPWKDHLCDNCNGRGEYLERDEDGEYIQGCFKCNKTGLK
jgi:broad specificity phosphatase PhoE